MPMGYVENLPKAYISKLDVLVLKNSPCQVVLIIWAQFLTDFIDNINILPLVTTELNHVLGLR
jgi:hypothetical protein